MATLKDVAQRAGVTVTTVSRMLNDRARVSEKTRLRIQNAMEELALRYSPVTADQVLSPSKWTWTCAPWPWEGEV